MSYIFLDTNNSLTKENIKKLEINRNYVVHVCDHLVSFFKDKNFDLKLEYTLNKYKNYNEMTLIQRFFGTKYINHKKINIVKFQHILKFNKNTLQFLNLETCKTKEFTLLTPRDYDKKDQIQISKIISEKFEEFIPTKRIYKLEDIGKRAKKYLDSKVINRNYMDYNSQIIPGIGTEFAVTKNFYEVGYGRDYTLNSSKYISYLEAVERYASIFYPYKDSALYGRFLEITNAIDPQKFILPSSSENPFRIYSHDLELYWTEGESLKNNEIIFVPEQLVVYGDSFYRKHEKQNRFIYDSSNGVALGGSYEEAIVSATLEIIERDCFLTSWYGAIRPPKVSEDIFNEEIKELSNYIKNKGYKLDIFSITKEIEVPCYWVLIRDYAVNSNMFSYNSAACHFDPNIAIKNALLEALVGIDVHNKNNKNNKKSIENVLSFEDHIQYYNDASRDYIYQEVTSSRYIKDQKFNEKPVTFGNFFKKILEGYEDIYIVNLTSDKMKKNNLYCVKVIIPGMLPMTFGVQNERVSLDIINNEHVRLGNGTVNKINKYPHPFP